MKFIWIILFLLLLVKNTTAREPVYRSPYMMMVNDAGSTLFICEVTSRTIAVMDIRTGNIKQRYPLSGPPGGLVITPDQEHLIVTVSHPEGIIHSIDLKTNKVKQFAKAGHTPTAILIHPGSERLFVCNRFNNDVSVIDLNSGKLIKTIPVRREPVAAALNKTGNYLLVVNHLPSAPSTSDKVSAEISVIDTDRLTIAKRITLPDGSTGAQGICISPDGRLAYVTHILARYKLPTTQLSRGWMNNNALSIIDLEKLELVNTVLLDNVEQGAANPWQPACSDDGRYLCVTHAGSNELSIIDQNALKDKLAEATEYSYGLIQSQKQDKVISDLSLLQGISQRILLPGNGPRGVVMVGHTAWVAEYYSDNLCRIEIDPIYATNISSHTLGPDQPLTEQRRGEILFHSARHCFQQWQSCASCHPGDARVDGLNWDLLNDGAGNPKDTRSLLYSHRTPPVMSLGVRANAETAVRAGIHHIQFSLPTEEDASAIDTYLNSLKPVPSPHLLNGKRSNSGRRGEKVFKKSNCAVCHTGTYYTDLRSYDVDTGLGRDTDKAFDTPSLNELWRTKPYLHDGRAKTLLEVLKENNKNDQHGITSDLTEREISDLIEYMLTL